MANTSMNKAFASSTKSIKKLFIQLKEGANEAGMSKAYGRNGPLADFVTGIIFPGTPDEVFSSILSTDETAVNIRKVYRELIAANLEQDLKVTDQFVELASELGFNNSKECFVAIAKAAKDNDTVEGILKEVSSTDTKKESKGSKVEEDLVKDTSANVDSESVKGTAKALDKAENSTLMDLTKLGGKQ